MLRAALACVVLALATPAAAGPKPTIAVIAVEGKDITSAKVGDAITTALRAEVAAKGRYSAKGSVKEIWTASVKAECKAIQPTCASAIGAALGVDYVIAGEADSRAKHYMVSLALVNVKTKQRVRSVRDTTASSADVRRWMRDVYGRLLDDQVGELTLVANADRGLVLLDGVEAGALFEGRVVLGGIATGSHMVAIRAPGFRPVEVEVTVDGTTRENVLLEPVATP